MDIKQVLIRHFSKLLLIIKNETKTFSTNSKLLEGNTLFVFIVLCYTSSCDNEKKLVLTKDDVQIDSLTQNASYNNKPFSGTLIFYDTISQSNLHVPYIKGKANGTVKGYYDSGALKITGTVINNSYEGKFYYFYENGDSMIVTTYKSNRWYGVVKSWETFNDSLNFYTEANYPYGKYVVWLNGNLSKIAYIDSNGNENGIFSIYDIDSGKRDFHYYHDNEFIYNLSFFLSDMEIRSDTSFEFKLESQKLPNPVNLLAKFKRGELDTIIQINN